MINQSQQQEHKANQSKYNSPDKPLQNQNRQIINTKGIHNTVQLILVIILSMLSASSVMITHNELYIHSRYMRTYCNLYILGNNDMSLYEDGLNIDQQNAQFSLIPDMVDHLLEILNITESIKTKNLAYFELPTNATILKIETVFKNKTIDITQFTTIGQAIDYLHIEELDLFKEYLLNTYSFKIDVYLGDNKYSQDYILTAKYKVHSFFMLGVDLEHQFTLKDQKMVKIDNIRVLQRLMALLLLVIYLYRFCFIINDQQQLVSQYQPMRHLNIDKMVIKYRNWYPFLMLMNLIIIFNAMYAPMCSFLQILPIFQFPQRQEEAKEGQMYNFNRNLRFSFPLIMTILFQMLIVLNGFVFFSILMYPGYYFDDYFQGFFSYFYQLFQVGTYQIFTQIQRYGKGAYLLYGILYFYVFSVGNSLIPALFVILIQMKITQKDIQSFTVNLISNCVCPNCQQRNQKKINKNNVQIMVFSPTLSPLINRKKLKSNIKQGKLNKNQQLMMIYIGDEVPDKQSVLLDNNNSNQYEINQSMIAFSSNINQKTRILSEIILLLKQRQELQVALQLIQENYIFSA